MSFASTSSCFCSFEFPLLVFLRNVQGFPPVVTPLQAGSVGNEGKKLLAKRDDRQIEIDLVVGIRCSADNVCKVLAAGPPQHRLEALPCTLRKVSRSHVHVSPRECFEHLSVDQACNHRYEGTTLLSVLSVLSCPLRPCARSMFVISERLGCRHWLAHAAG